MLENEQEIPTYKIVLLGDSGVGKTNIVSQFIRGKDRKNTIPTIGVEFATKTIFLQSMNAYVKAHIWDTAGQERYKSITSAHYRKALGALLVFDITNEKSFDNIPIWFSDLKLYTGDDIRVLLIGNKLDLVDNDPLCRKVSKERAMNYAKDNGMLYKETSVFQDKNISNCFIDLLEAIYNHKNRGNKEKDANDVVFSHESRTMTVETCSKCKC